MLTFPEIDPIAIDIGFIKIRWYGLMYVIGFFAGWTLARYRAKRRSDIDFTGEDIDGIIFYLALGVIIGARVGYVLFYNFGLFLREPLYLFRVWEGGMSFHGGVIGVIVAAWLFGRRYQKSFLAIFDLITPFAPIGLAAGRIGNFINAELWGRTTDVPWGMVFPGGGSLPRHPSQLYEAALEGLALFLILWFYSVKPRPRGAVAGLFLLGYGAFRTFVEFFREPDGHIGYLVGDWLTMGILLSLPMVIAGVAIVYWAYRTQPIAAPTKKRPASQPKRK